VYFKIPPTGSDLPYYVELMFCYLASTSRLQQFDLSMSNTELRDVLEEAEYIQKPQDNGNHYNAIQDAFDLALHGDIAIH
jgi:hypothetical protein